MIQSVPIHVSDRGRLNVDPLAGRSGAVRKSLRASHLQHYSQAALLTSPTAVGSSELSGCRPTMCPEQCLVQTLTARLQTVLGSGSAEKGSHYSGIADWNSLSDCNGAAIVFEFAV